MYPVLYGESYLLQSERLPQPLLLSTMTWLTDLKEKAEKAEASRILAVPHYDFRVEATPQRILALLAVVEAAEGVQRRMDLSIKGIGYINGPALLRALSYLLTALTHLSELE
jgi:hypothetical protein